jgi:hypothetical protein
MARPPKPKWRLPPRSWFGKPENRTRTLREAMDAYYALHPERLPPPEVLKKFQPPSQAALDEALARNARLGNPDPLILRLRDSALSPAIVEVIVEALESLRGKGYRDVLRRIEQTQIARQIEHLVRKGVKQEAAVADVRKLRNCSRAHIYNAIRADKRRGGSI